MNVWQIIIDTFSRFTVTDAIDILLISYAVYRLALAMRGTQAMPLLKGLGVLVVLVGVSKLFPTCDWIVSSVVPIALIALVIIFQPELRSSLEQLGRGTLGGPGLAAIEREQIEDVIGEVMDACEEFQDRELGALIVLERDTQLSDIIRTGKVLDARASSELIATLFAPRSPLHDGAIVIREGRIVAAGCALPHSDNPGLSATTGMRHRAALGLAELTDAVSVVVSEETGAMSLAVNGTLSPDLERIQMTERLLKLFEGRTESPSFFFWRM